MIAVKIHDFVGCTPKLKSLARFLTKVEHFKVINQKKKLFVKNIAYSFFGQIWTVRDLPRQIRLDVVIKCIYGFTCVCLRLRPIFKGWSLRGKFYEFQRAVDSIFLPQLTSNFVWLSLRILENHSRDFKKLVLSVVEYANQAGNTNVLL